MKIGILTHHDVHNHGAQLQLYALKQVLEHYGHQAAALTYTKNYDFISEQANQKYHISLKSIPYYLGYFIKKGVRRTLFNIKKRSMLADFRHKQVLVGEYYSRARELDCVFIGSDEVFSLETGLNPFFWGFGVPCRSVFAYAASFGTTTLAFVKAHYAAEFVAGGVARLSAISVRDKNSQDIIASLSIVNPPIVCDPVILHGYLEEKARFKKPVDARYILIYAYDENMNDPTEVTAIQAYAKGTGSQLISAGFYHKWCDQCINVSPIELLEYVWGADQVITDTFHGTVMSIIFGRQFVSRVRINANKLRFLLHEYGLEDRAIDDFGRLAQTFDQAIDYGLVNQIIEKKRQDSRKFIESCLEQAAS